MIARHRLTLLTLAAFSLCEREPWAGMVGEEIWPGRDRLGSVLAG